MILSSHTVMSIDGSNPLLCKSAVTGDWMNCRADEHSQNCFICQHLFTPENLWRHLLEGHHDEILVSCILPRADRRDRNQDRDCLHEQQIDQGDRCADTYFTYTLREYSTHLQTVHHGEICARLKERIIKLFQDSTKRQRMTIPAIVHPHPLTTSHSRAGVIMSDDTFVPHPELTIPATNGVKRLKRKRTTRQLAQKCPFCVHVFYSSVEVMAHLRTVRHDVAMSCKMPDHLQRNTVDLSEDRLRCRFCTYTRPSVAATDHLQDHWRKTHRSERCKTNVTKYDFTQLDQHYLTEHQFEDGPEPMNWMIESMHQMTLEQTCESLVTEVTAQSDLDVQDSTASRWPQRNFVPRATRDRSRGCQRGLINSEIHETEQSSYPCPVPYECDQGSLLLSHFTETDGEHPANCDVM